MAQSQGPNPTIRPTRPFRVACLPTGQPATRQHVNKVLNITQEEGSVERREKLLKGTILDGFKGPQFCLAAKGREAQSEGAVSFNKEVAVSLKICCNSAATRFLSKLTSILEKKVLFYVFPRCSRRTNKTQLTATFED